MIHFTIKKMSSFMGLALLFIVLTTVTVYSQSEEKRASPAETASGMIGDVNVEINYSSPAVKGRKIWGGLEPYDKVWRTGANEATTISFDKDVMIEGEELSAGKYALFTIPSESEWTVIFNKTADQWGAFDYDEAQDALRVKVKPDKADEFQERLKFDVNDDGEVAMAWENVKVAFNVEPAE